MDDKAFVKNFSEYLLKADVRLKSPQLARTDGLILGVADKRYAVGIALLYAAGYETYKDLTPDLIRRFRKQERRSWTHHAFSQPAGGLAKLAEFWSVVENLTAADENDRRLDEKALLGALEKLTRADATNRSLEEKALQTIVSKTGDELKIALREYGIPAPTRRVGAAISVTVSISIAFGAYWGYPVVSRLSPFGSVNPAPSVSPTAPLPTSAPTPRSTAQVAPQPSPKPAPPSTPSPKATPSPRRNDPPAPKRSPSPRQLREVSVSFFTSKGQQGTRVSFDGKLLGDWPLPEGNEYRFSIPVGSDIEIKWQRPGGTIVCRQWVGADILVRVDVAVPSTTTTSCRAEGAR